MTDTQAKAQEIVKELVNSYVLECDVNEVTSIIARHIEELVEKAELYRSLTLKAIEQMPSIDGLKAERDALRAEVEVLKGRIKKPMRKGW